MAFGGNTIICKHHTDILSPWKAVMVNMLAKFGFLSVCVSSRPIATLADILSCDELESIIHSVFSSLLLSLREISGALVRTTGSCGSGGRAVANQPERPVVRSPPPPLCMLNFPWARYRIQNCH